MGLLEDIQSDILNDDIPLATVLRKALVLASKLGSNRLRDWASYELNGYPNDAELPSYRVIQCESRCDLSGMFQSFIKNAPVPITLLPEWLQEWATEVKFPQSISALEDTVTRSEGGTLTLQWPPEYFGLVKGLNPDFVVFHVWKVVSASAVASAIDSVRTNLLNFVLELENLDGSSDIPSLGVRQKEVVESKITNHIYGNNNVVASGHNVSQHIQADGIRVGDLEQLLKLFRDLAMPSELLEELKKAIADDKERADKAEIGNSVTAWMGKALAFATKGAWNIGVGAAGSMLAKAISAYYGLGASS